MAINNSTTRVFVGIDGSLASLLALREAAAEARQRHGELHVIHVRPPEPLNPPPIVGVFGLAAPWPGPEPPDWLDNAALQLIHTSLGDALGEAPTELDVHPSVLVGRPHRELVSAASHDGDLLVIGTRGGRRWRHPRRRSVSRYCGLHAHCLVLVVPCDPDARTMWRRMRLGRRVLPRDPWKEFDATARSQQTHSVR